MKTITITKPQVNSVMLLSELSQSLRDISFSVGVDSGVVQIMFNDDVSTAVADQVKSIVSNHDATKLSPEQQAEAAQKAKLDQMRNDFGASDIDLKVFAGKDALLVQLAQKVAWLEQEINQQKGGNRE